MASALHQLTVQRRRPIYTYSNAPIACPGLAGDIEGRKGFTLAFSLPSKCPFVAFKGHARPRLVDRSCGASRLLGLVGLSTQARSGRAAEVTAERGSQEGAENDFGTPITLSDEISRGN